MSASFPSSGGGSPTPTAVKDGQVLRVKPETQLLYAEPIEIEGDGVIQIDGALIEVD